MKNAVCSSAVSVRALSAQSAHTMSYAYAVRFFSYCFFYYKGQNFDPQRAHTDMA